MVRRGGLVLASGAENPYVIGLVQTTKTRETSKNVNPTGLGTSLGTLRMSVPTLVGRPPAHLTQSIPPATVSTPSSDNQNGKSRIPGRPKFTQLTLSHDRPC